MSPTVTCTQPGEVISLAIDSASRGYSYRIALYLPPCYAGQADAYPVLYLIPGRGSGPSAWFSAGANTIAAEVILAGKLQPFLMVATGTTDGDPQGEAITNEIIPYIEKHYRVLAGREHRAVAGASLGGIAAYRLVFQHPEIFSSAGIFGSGVVSGEETAFQSWLTALESETPVRVFLACGSQDVLMQERARITAALLETAKIPYVYEVIEGGHDYATWATGFDQYLQWLSRGW